MAMSKKNYEKAAAIVRAWREAEIGESPVKRAGATVTAASVIEEAFVLLFKDDNPSYDVARFRAACRK
jgi:hypothetical protein